MTQLHLAGAVFLAVIVVSNVTNAFKDYRQRRLNARVVLSLRRSLFQRLLHLPLPRLREMQTGGILSRLTGDVDTTTGLLQMAIVSPGISIVRLTVAVTVLVLLNWRLALTILAIVPGVMLMSFTLARRVRPIYRSLRKDAERIDGRVGETFSGIRVVRAFRRETGELLEYMRGRHTVLRKELFAHRREMMLWTACGVSLGTVSVVIVWYGGYLNVTGGASIGDIMAFQWYAFLLLNPVWQIVNSFSELQRSLAAMERVFELLAMPEDKPDRPDAIDAPRSVLEIRFEHVEFAYREGRPVVIDFDVTVPGDSVVALVGRSGAGKTTVTIWSRASTTLRAVAFSSTARIFEIFASARIAICWPSCSRTSSCSTARCATTSRTAATMRRTRTSRMRRAGRTRTSSSCACPSSTTRSSVSAA